MPPSDYRLRPALPGDGEAIADMWHDAWHDAHDELVDPAWRNHRNRDNFHARVGAMIPNATIAEQAGAVIGLSSILADEMHQLFVSRSARGSGLAAALIADAEKRLRDQGVGRAWLFCAKGNRRAYRFYEKMGWRETAEDFQSLEVDGSEYRVTVHRMEKTLNGRGKE